MTDRVHDDVGVYSPDWSYSHGLDWVEYSNVGIHASNDREKIKTLIEEGNEPSRVIVAGSRSIKDEELVYKTISEAPKRWWQWNPSELVHGGAEGPDSIASTMALQHSSPWDVVTHFEPRWNKFGPKAGPLRNEEMARYADYLIAISENHSDGTEGMIDLAREYELDYYVKQV